MTLRPFLLALVWTFAGCLSWSSASAFPGLLVDRDGSKRYVHTTHVVVLVGGEVSVVTVMIDYEGPPTPFALLLPVPSDVDVKDVRTLRREIVSRVEEVSAPRMHDFYEMDPCERGPTEQSWEERVRPRTRGFLTSPMLPPPDASYRISNEMSVPSRPVFKGVESEFSHTLLSADNAARLEAELSSKNYRVSKTALKRLAAYLAPGAKFLLSEVHLDRVELLGKNALQLGGIRYTTRRGVPRLDSTLGLTDSPGTQDLFIYVLAERDRFEVANYPNVFAPTNVSILPNRRLDVGQAYNALFDRVVSSTHPFVTEYAWPTKGCGEPCPNAPLQLEELLSLGGDELEALRPKEVREAPDEPERSDDADARALAERRALIARQRYLLTRLHYRYQPERLPRDIELVPAKGHVRGGVGVPAGPSATLPTTTTESTLSTFQIRFFASHAWSGATNCNKPKHWRWGKRWKSMERVSRRVPLALDLPRLGRDPAPLRAALARPIAGIEPSTATKPQAPRPDRALPASADDDTGGCSFAPARDFSPWFAPALLAWAARIRRRRRNTRSRSRTDPKSGRSGPRL